VLTDEVRAVRDDIKVRVAVFIQAEGLEKEAVTLRQATPRWFPVERFL
jgi:hypothetical protein